MLTLTKIIFAAIGVWYLALVLLFVFPTLLPSISGLALLFSVPVAAVLLILTLVAFIKEKRRRWPLCAALIIVIFFLALPRVMYWGALVHLHVYRRSYETTAQRMLAARDDEERQRICGEECWLVSSDGGQVAFHYVHGFLNWKDIIYDPSGKVVALRSYDERKRFNLYFVDAEHLTGDWYLGHFGD